MQRFQDIIAERDLVELEVSFEEEVGGVVERPFARVFQRVSSR